MLSFLFFWIHRIELKAHVDTTCPLSVQIKAVGYLLTSFVILELPNCSKYPRNSSTAPRIGQLGLVSFGPEAAAGDCSNFDCLMTTAAGADKLYKPDPRHIQKIISNA